MHRLTNFILVIVSTILSFVFINLFFLSIYNQDIFPRSLVRYSGNILYPFYPRTYDFEGSSAWNAILGDSNAQGMGDAYSDGIYNYSSAHYLNDKTKENFLIFGASGSGSIYSAKNLVDNFNTYKYSWIFPDLDKPEAIYFFFYEGNDLNNNIDHMKARIAIGESIENFVNRMIEEPSNHWYIDAYIPFGRIIYNYFRINLIKIMKDDPPKTTELTFPNSLSIPGHSVSVGTLQSSAVELTEEEIEKSLAVLFSSVIYLQEWSRKSKIIIVYLPSAVSSYSWDEPIEIQKYSSNNVRFTTNENNRNISGNIRERIREFCVSLNFSFVDTTPAITKLGSSKFAHGPKDWKHFNSDGYAAIASAIIEQIHNSE